MFNNFLKVRSPYSRGRDLHATLALNCYHITGQGAVLRLGEGTWAMCRLRMNRLAAFGRTV